MEKFVEYIEKEVKWLYEKFSQKPMIEFTDALKENKGQQKSVTSASKSLITHRIKR